MDGFGFRKLLVGPKPVIPSEIACLSKKVHTVSVSVALRVIQVTHLEGAIRLVGVLQTPIKHAKNLGANLLSGGTVESWPRGSEDSYRVPVQMVLIVAVELDAGRKVDMVELQKAPGDHVLVLN